MSQEIEKDQDKEARETEESKTDIIKDIDNKIKELSQEKTPLNKIIIESLSKERETIKKELEKANNDLSIQELNQRKAVLKADLEEMQKTKKVNITEYNRLKIEIAK